jgi:hypothetical protein
MACLFKEMNVSFFKKILNKYLKKKYNPALTNKAR